MTHKGTKTLENNRLLLRRFTLDDAQAMYDNWGSAPEVSKYLAWPVHTSVNDSREVLGSWVPQYKNDDFYDWAIVLKEYGDTPIGGISTCNHEDKTKMVEVGYCVGQKWWGQGITTEAFKLVISFFFNEVKVNRIMAKHDTKNPASGRVMEKCGLIYEGTLRQSGVNKQGVCDKAIWAILAQDYYSTHFLEDRLN